MSRPIDTYVTVVAPRATVALAAGAATTALQSGRGSAGFERTPVDHGFILDEVLVERDEGAITESDPLAVDYAGIS